MRARVTRSGHMICHPAAWAAWAALSVTAALAGEEAAGPAAEGSLATQDFVAPVDLDVVDAATTAANAAAAGENLPLVVRRVPLIAEKVGAEFDAAFHTSRRAYLDALEARFGTRTIPESELESPRFRSFRSEFQASNLQLPVNLALSQAWARGWDGEDVRKRHAAALEATMANRLIGDIRPASTVFVVSLAATDLIQTWGEASGHARNIEPAEIASIEVAGRELRQTLDIIDRGAGGYLASLLQPTMAEDLYLTGLLLRERLGEKVVARHYQRGEYIVHAGQNIDANSARALAQLGRMGMAPLASAPGVTAAPSTAVETPVSARSPADPSPPGLEHRDAHALRTSLVVISWVGLGVLVLGAFTLWSHRRRRAATPPWLDRPAAAPRANLREAIVPHLARELKNRLVQALFAQRQELLHNEAAASQRVADLEARLAKLQPAIAEKIRGYEKRIAALESELEEKDQETRDLIRAKLILARKELDAEITRHRASWN